MRTSSLARSSRDIKYKYTLLRTSSLVLSSRGVRYTLICILYTLYVTYTSLALSVGGSSLRSDLPRARPPHWRPYFSTRRLHATAPHATAFVPPGRGATLVHTAAARGFHRAPPKRCITQPTSLAARPSIQGHDALFSLSPVYAALFACATCLRRLLSGARRWQD